MYRTLNEALQAQFGCKVYKLALDGGMTCPNRDGTCGARGCSFCGRAGGGEFAARGGDVAAQLAAAKARVAAKGLAAAGQLLQQRLPAERGRHLQALLQPLGLLMGALGIALQLLSPFQQAKRYAAELPYSQRPR